MEVQRNIQNKEKYNAKDDSLCYFEKPSTDDKLGDKNRSKNLNFVTEEKGVGVGR